MRLTPGSKVKMVLEEGDGGERSLRLKLHAPEVTVVLTDFGLPIIQNGATERTTFDTAAFIAEGREAYLDRKLGIG